MQENSWRKVLVSLALFCFVFGLGIYQAEARIFDGGRSHIFSRNRQAKGKGICEASAAKSGMLKSASTGLSVQGLGGTGSISGHVREYAEDGLGNPIEGPPLANIQVQLSQGVDPNWADDQAWDWVASTNTDANGFYQFNGLTERRYHLHIYEGQEVGGKHYVRADQYQVQVMEGALTPNIDFTLRQAGLVWGYVKKTDGTPMPYAQVVARASYTYDGNSWHGAWTDANGRYELWLLPSPGKFYPIVVEEALTPGTTYKVYGGNSSISGEDGLDPASHGYTFLGSATNTSTFSGAYSYYVILAEPDYLVKVDAVQRPSSSYLWPSDGWGNISDWGNINGSPPDGNFTSINYQYLSQGAYMLFNPGPGSTGLTVYIVADGRSSDPLSYEAKIAPGLYQSTLTGVHGPDFSLNEGGGIYGRVINEQGEGIKNAEMWASVWTTNGKVCGSCHMTNSDGYYTLTSIPATDMAYVMGGGEIQQDGVKYGNVGYMGPLSVTAGNTTQAPDITLLVAGMITGRVTDENGVASVGAMVEAWGYGVNGYEVGSEDVYTDAFGQYTLDYLVPGTYTVRVEKDGFTDGVKGDVVVASESQVDCDLVMRSTSQAATVSGIITNFNQIAAKDVDGVLLPCHDEDSYSDYGYPEVELIAFQGNVAYTDEDYLSIDKFIMGFAEPDDGYEDYFKVSTTETAGNYNVVLPAGEIDLAALSYLGTEDGEYVVLYDWHTLTLTPGATFSNQNFTLPTNNGTLKGSISVPSGSSLKSGKTIILAFNENDSNLGLVDALAWPEFGTTYSFAQIPAGTYTIRAITDGFVTKVYQGVSVIEGQITTRNIEFVAGGALTGTVTDTNTAAAVTGAKVKVVETGSFVMTGANGEYSISGLAAGSYTVEVSASAYATATQTAVAIADGATATLNVTLNSQVGSIAGTVTVTAGGANINGATVVAYNPADFSSKTATTVGGAYTITGLTYGDYVVAVNADGYETTVYAGSVNVNSPTTTGIDFSLAGIAPEFSVSSSVGATTLSMTFYADVALDAVPAFTVVTGSGALGTQTQVSATQWEVDYTPDANDTVVEIKIEGDHNGQPGSAAFSFEVSSNLVQTASTNVTNATGGETTMMGTQDNTSVYVPPFALAGVSDTTAVPLTIERYGDPGDSVGGTNDQSASAIYDFSFEDGNVTIEENHTITVTMSFVLPAGMTQQEFEDTFEVRYFNVNTQQWETISNVRINWNNYTVMFEVNHLTEFGVFLPGDNIPSGWNLISLPQQPTDTAIESVLSSISGKYESVWAFKNSTWEVYDPASPGFSDLTEMEAGWGYWIKMTEAASFSISGTTPSDTIPLVSGWNLVGYNSTNSQDIADALASIDTKYVSVWAFMNGGWKVYDPANPGFSDLLTMEPNYGYWINTTQACTWTLPTP